MNLSPSTANYSVKAINILNHAQKKAANACYFITKKSLPVLYFIKDSVVGFSKFAASELQSNPYIYMYVIISLILVYIYLKYFKKTSKEIKDAEKESYDQHRLYTNHMIISLHNLYSETDKEKADKKNCDHCRTVFIKKLNPINMSMSCSLSANTYPGK